DVTEGPEGHLAERVAANDAVTNRFYCGIFSVSIQPPYEPPYCSLVAGAWNHLDLQLRELLRICCT
ncbi:hypothetical protein ABTK17_19075, partial [Acinetobacter baumannii]